MFSALSRVFIVMLLGLAFIGQAMASTMMPYHMMSMEVMSIQEQPHDMSQMDHSNHSMMSDFMSEKLMSEESPSDESMKDCCEQICKCFTSGYSTFITLNKIMDNSLVIESSLKIIAIVSQVQSQTPTSLYKPPILS